MGKDLNEFDRQMRKFEIIMRRVDVPVGKVTLSCVSPVQEVIGGDVEAVISSRDGAELNARVHEHLVRERESETPTRKGDPIAIVQGAEYKDETGYAVVAGTQNDKGGLNVEEEATIWFYPLPSRD
jgi:hypothetical protein